jgi:hypothetical protein
MLFQFEISLPDFETHLIMLHNSQNFPNKLKIQKNSILIKRNFSGFNDFHFGKIKCLLNIEFLNVINIINI